MQNFNDIPEDQSLTDSRLVLLNNLKTVLSNFSGTVFPTQNLQQGMFCYRSDEGKFYGLRTLPSDWILVLDLSKSFTEWLAGYTPVAHLTNDASHTKAQVGLGNVDNTADADKPVSTPQANAIASAVNNGVSGKVNRAGDNMTGPLNFSTIQTIASSINIDLGAATSNNILITGTTEIIGFGVAPSGAVRICRFAGSLKLWHDVNYTTLPSNADIITEAEDVIILESQGGGKWKCLTYFRASGFSLHDSAPSKRNILINGGMQVSQRGTSITVASVTETVPLPGGNIPTSVGTVDMWRVINDNTGVSLTLNQTSLQIDKLGSHSVLIAPSASLPVVPSNAYAGLETNIEMPRLLSLYEKPITISFYVKSSVAGLYAVKFGSWAGGSWNLSSFVINQANVWEKKSITIKDGVPSSWRTNTATLQFPIVAGASIQRSINAGYSSMPTLVGLSGGANPFATGGAFQIGNVQLEGGTVATPFEYRSYSRELAECLPYFERIVPSSGYGSIASGGQATTTLWRGNLKFSPKRSFPTISFTPSGVWGVLTGTNTVTLTPNGAAAPVTAQYVTKSSALLECTTTSTTAGVPGVLLAGSSSEYIDINSELGYI